MTTSNDEKCESIVPEHSGTGTVSTNLAPSSFPEQNRTTTISVCACYFSLMLEVNRKNFIKYFKQKMTKLKKQWGEEQLNIEPLINSIKTNLPPSTINSLRFSNPSFNKFFERCELLGPVINGFISQIKPKSTMTPILCYPLIPELGASSYYFYQFHAISFKLDLVKNGFSKLDLKNLAKILYHELRHAEQVLFITRFMLGRGEDPLSPVYNIFEEIIDSAKQMDDQDLVKEGTGGKMIQGHRHYNCVITLYASFFGDEKIEKNLIPNIYETGPYKVPKDQNRKMREQFEIDLNQEKIKINNELNVEAAKESILINNEIRVMRSKGASEQKVMNYIKNRQETVESKYKDKLAKKDIELYKHIFAEKDAYQTADPIDNEFDKYK